MENLIWIRVKRLVVLNLTQRLIKRPTFSVVFFAFSLFVLALSPAPLVLIILLDICLFVVPCAEPLASAMIICISIIVPPKHSGTLDICRWACSTMRD